jgi:sugar/nucleoside kinase (ribokinase family)|tara:strand:- start:736 stop:1719 length:984 start_codon:yes stop_codon:yes gene_type:complete
MENNFNILGISNAIVDILSQVTDDFLVELNAEPGSMMLINESDASSLYEKMQQKKEMSGGSIANTIACYASFGGTAGYIGQVKKDALGETFVADMLSLGVDVRLSPAENGSPTARSHVLITEDGQRTMQTYLGACTELSADNINQQTIGHPNIILLEGYLWDIKDSIAIANKVIKYKSSSEVKIALSLSDAFCVERHHKIFKELVNNHIDIVFGNQDELMALTKATSLEEMKYKVASHQDTLFIITQGEEGSLIIKGNEIIKQDAIFTSNVVDTTGAGDTFTAGFLYGLSKKKSLQECAQIGSWAACKVIQQIGARIDQEILNRYEV